MQLIAAQIIVVIPAHGSPCQLIEQAARRVRAPTEETLVGNGYAQDGQLQAADHGLDSGR